MNKKQKILTIVALAVFGVIIFLHYYDRSEAIFSEEDFFCAREGLANITSGR
jgi:hypothetical protein